jgi:hypothetical protein
MNLLKRAKGVEPDQKRTISKGNSQVSVAGGAKAAPTVSAPVAADADLRAVAEAWPTLPQAIKTGILAMVRASHAPSP